MASKDLYLFLIAQVERKTVHSKMSLLKKKKPGESRNQQKSIKNVY